MIKSYQIISLLNYLSKVIEKLIANQLSQFCENFEKLYKGQMGAKKRRLAIDAATILVQQIDNSWKDKKIIRALLIDVKEAFDHVFQAELVKKMLELGIDNDLIRWTQSFLTDKWIELVIDGYINAKQKVETGILQNSPVSSILFLIYISGVFF